MTDQNAICRLGKKGGAITFDITNYITRKMDLQESKEKLLIKSMWQILRVKLSSSRLQMLSLKPM